MIGDLCRRVLGWNGDEVVMSLGEDQQSIEAQVLGTGAERRWHSLPKASRELSHADTPDQDGTRRQTAFSTRPFSIGGRKSDRTIPGICVANDVFISASEHACSNTTK
jgi:hypothetical protein